MSKKPLKVLLISMVSGKGKGFNPVPPLMGYAPDWNAFRLAEGLAERSDVTFTVVSPCTTSQLVKLKEKQYKGRYEWIVYSDSYITLRKIIKKDIPVIRGVVNQIERNFLQRVSYLSLWTFYDYLHRIRKIPAYQDADLIIQNDMPQLLNHHALHVPRRKLAFFCRGHMGNLNQPITREMVERMTQCGAILVANAPMQAYIYQLFDKHITNGELPTVYIVPNGLGSEFNPPSPPNDRFFRKEKLILFSGRFIEHKGVKELVKAFQIVNNKHPKVKLRIVGATEFSNNLIDRMSPYEREVKNLISQMSPDTVELAGYKPYSEMPQEYASADIAVFPSTVIEGFGMVALEAMRCRTPVVASNQPGFRELIVPGETGFLVDPYDIGSIASAILYLIENPQKAKLMGENGYKRSLNYGLEPMINGFMDFVNHYFYAKEHS